MAIQLFDSLTRTSKVLGQREGSAPPVSKEHPFAFYNCGPTVYAPAHIGNFRTFVVNDVLRRLLELEFGPGKVKHVRNLTDVDDRTIGQSKKEGHPLGEITQKWTDKFHEDCAALNCLRPHVEPTATGHIPEQVNMIEVLMQKGNAYRAPDGSVYFKITSFPDYGALSRIKERELKVTNSAFDADHKDDIGDFALWKAYKPEDDGDVQWPGPQGAAAGRPGWHIECSAMIKKHLGETIDLHTGGVDLLFPHHENEIAQSQCCNGTTFARHWYHSEHLLVDGTTMSKSKGNYYTLGDLVAKGYSPMAVRYALLMGHPRKQLNFTLDSLHAAESALDSLRSLYSNLQHAAALEVGDIPSKRFEAVFDALRDDLNMPAALGALFSIRADVEKTMKGQSGERISKGDLLAFEQVLKAFGFDLKKESVPQTAAPAEVQKLADERKKAKLEKNFASADALRKEIAASGWNMKDNKDGSYILEPIKKA